MRTQCKSLEAFKIKPHVVDASWEQCLFKNHSLPRTAKAIHLQASNVVPVLAF